MQSSFSPKLSTQVAEPLMPILCSMFADGDVVELAERAVRVDAELRDDEQREALGAGGRAVDAREHEVDDVLGQVVIAAGDEDLGAADACSVPSPFCVARGARRADVAAGLRLGEAHRAAPLAVEHARRR